jgi:hypothetical protein
MESLFNKLLSEADKAEEGIEHLPLLEPYLAKVLDYIHAHPEHRPEVLARFIQILNDTGPISSVTIAYCMHDLRWPEILMECQRLAKDPQYDRRRIHGIWDILNAYTPDWDGKLFYARFRSQI